LQPEEGGRSDWTEQEDFYSLVVNWGLSLPEENDNDPVKKTLRREVVGRVAGAKSGGKKVRDGAICEAATMGGDTSTINRQERPNRNCKTVVHKTGRKCGLASAL